MKNVAVLTQDWTFALFFRPHPRGFESSRVPSPGNLPSQEQAPGHTRWKEMLMPGGEPGGRGRWAQLELTDALLSDWYKQHPTPYLVSLWSQRENGVFLARTTTYREMRSQCSTQDRVRGMGKNLLVAGPWWQNFAADLWLTSELEFSLSE